MIRSADVVFDDATFAVVMDQVVPGTTLDHMVQLTEAQYKDAHVQGLERVRWGNDPTVGEDAATTGADFENLVTDLRQQGRPFFVMGETTLLYGLAGMPSPQPLLYLHPLQSFV